MALSVRNVVFLPFYYARDAKIFEKHGLNVELIQMRSDLQLAGLASGEIDYTPSAGPAVTAFANGLPVKALAVLYRAPLFSLVGPPALANVKELEGKKVAVSRIGSESHRYGSLMIESGGADPKKVQIVSFKAGGDLMIQLLGGHVPVISTGLSEAIEQVKAGKVRVIAVSSPRPLPGELANVPTWRSMGIDVSILHWRGLFAPPGVPADTVKYWDATLGKMVKTDSWKKGFLEKSVLEDGWLVGDAFLQAIDREMEVDKGVFAELGMLKK